MLKLVLKRGREFGLSRQNAFRVPYEGFLDGELIGVVYYNPVTKELFPESKSLLKKLGCEKADIEVI